MTKTERIAAIIKSIKRARLAGLSYRTWRSTCPELFPREDLREIYGEILGLRIPRDYAERTSTRLMWFWIAIGWTRWIGAPTVRSWNPCNNEPLGLFESRGCTADD